MPLLLINKNLEIFSNHLARQIFKLNTKKWEEHSNSEKKENLSAGPKWQFSLPGLERT